MRTLLMSNRHFIRWHKGGQLTCVRALLTRYSQAHIRYARALLTRYSQAHIRYAYVNHTLSYATHAAIKVTLAVT